MTTPAETPAPAPGPTATGVAPAAVVPTPAPAAGILPDPSPAPAVTRPEWLAEDHWDTTANTIKPEFGTHYAELKAIADAETARKATIITKPEDVKFEVKLPDGVKAPEGMDLRINENDPRVPVLREMAVKHGWTQEQVNELVALDAKVQIDNHAAAMARVAEEDGKLGANAKPRKEAVANWLKGMKDRNEFSADEYAAIRDYAVDAATVTALEKIIAKAAGSVPAHQPGTPPAPQPKTLAERMYPNLPSAKAS